MKIKLFEYLLIVSPSNSIAKRAQTIKAYFTSNYGCALSVQNMPHITFAHFVIFEQMEKRILGCFETFANYINRLLLN